jgi:hypothetical protein
VTSTPYQYRRLSQLGCDAPTLDLVSTSVLPVHIGHLVIIIGFGRFIRSSIVRVGWVKPLAFATPTLAGLAIGLLVSEAVIDSLLASVFVHLPVPYRLTVRLRLPRPNA